MDTVGSYEAKTHLPKLLERVQRGEQFTITRHGVPIALLVPVSGSKREDIEGAVKEIKAFRERHRLDGLTVREMVEEGRRH